MKWMRPGVYLAALAGLSLTVLTVAAYTASQAEGGQQVFANICAACHGATLQGGMGPALVGSGFQAAWRNAAALFSFVSQQMPLNNPGSLSREQAWNVVSYLLNRNGINPDEQPLDETTAKQTKVSQGVAR